MALLLDSGAAQIIHDYGYWAVFGLVGIESTGVPLPGETGLVTAAIVAGSTHDLSIALVVAAAIAGAVLGDNLGFWVGRRFGTGLLLRYGRYIRLDEKKLKLGQYLFLRHGGKIVFFGRFIAVLRTFAALLAGANQMRWPRFLVFNVCGGALWATIYGLGAYGLGTAVEGLQGPLGWTALSVAAIVAIGVAVFVHYNLARLQADAERALPGPLTVPRRRQKHR